MKLSPPFVRSFVPLSRYGTATPHLVFVERKTHREDWWGDGDASAKERFPLAEDQVMPFLQGRLSPDEVSSPPHASPHASPRPRRDPAACLAARLAAPTSLH